MENNRKDPSAMVDNWLDEILQKTELADEITPDEEAVSALTHPDDAELAA